MNILVVGTSNSIREFDWTTAFNKSRPGIKFERRSHGKSREYLWWVTGRGPDIADYQFVNFDLAVKEHVSHACGLPLDRISDHLRSLVATFWSHGCLPVFMRPPRRDVQAPDALMRSLDVELAQELSVPYFDGLTAVDEPACEGVSLDDLFCDGGHIEEWVAIGLSHSRLAGLTALPKPHIESAHRNRKTFSLAPATPSDRDRHVNVIRRATRLIADNYIVFDPRKAIEGGKPVVWRQTSTPRESA